MARILGRSFLLKEGKPPNLNKIFEHSTRICLNDVFKQMHSSKTQQRGIFNGVNKNGTQHQKHQNETHAFRMFCLWLHEHYLHLFSQKWQGLLE